MNHEQLDVNGPVNYLFVTEGPSISFIVSSIVTFVYKFVISREDIVLLKHSSLNKLAINKRIHLLENGFDTELLCV